MGLAFSELLTGYHLWPFNQSDRVVAGDSMRSQTGDHRPEEAHPKLKHHIFKTFYQLSDKNLPVPITGSSLYS